MGIASQVRTAKSPEAPLFRFPMPSRAWHDGEQQGGQDRTGQASMGLLSGLLLSTILRNTQSQSVSLSIDIIPSPFQNPPICLSASRVGVRVSSLSLPFIPY